MLDLLFNQYEPVKEALVSICGNYRYKLSRIWDNAKPIVVFVMLNPSTADGSVDDPTIRRCIGFARDWGCGGLEVVNLFALRATDPKQLLIAPDPMGRDNRFIFGMTCRRAQMIVCAWGNSHIIKKLDITVQVDILMCNRRKLHFIELANDHTPKHPLYLSKFLKPQPFVFKFK